MRQIVDVSRLSMCLSKQNETVMWQYWYIYCARLVVYKLINDINIFKPFREFVCRGCWRSYAYIQFLSKSFWSNSEFTLKCWHFNWWKLMPVIFWIMTLSRVFRWTFQFMQIMRSFWPSLIHFIAWAHTQREGGTQMANRHTIGWPHLCILIIIIKPHYSNPFELIFVNKHRPRKFIYYLFHFDTFEMNNCIHKLINKLVWFDI